MRKSLLKVFIIFSLILLVLTACDHNVYLVNIEKVEDVWEVQGKTFYKFSDALAYYLSTLGSKAITSDDVILLLRDVPETERGEGIVIPATFPADGNLRVDFNGHEYWFYDNLEYFFEIRHGETIEIINGTTVIDVPANPVPKALVVNTKTVTIDDHLIDDRRPVPKALEVQEGGIVKVVSSSNNTGNALKGEVTVAGGGQLDVDGGYIEATTIEAATNSTGEKAQVNLSGGYIIAEELNINNNAVVTVTGGLLSTETVKAESTDSSNKAVFNLKGGDFDTENLNALDNSEINISEEDPSTPAYAYIQNTTIESTASFTVDDGDVTFSTTIKKEGSGTFEISGGDIHNPHSLTPKVTQAITDGNGTGNATNIVIHDPLEHHEKVDATCTSDGKEEYWECLYDGCGKLFADKNCTNEISAPVVIPALGHISPLEHFGAVAATCTKTGNIEYWHCGRCGSYFSDEAGTTEITYESTILPIDASNHSIEVVEAVAPTCTETGNIHYWHCTRCGKSFSDSEGNTEISQASTVDPATGHTPGEWEFDDDYHWRNCSVCGEELVHEEHHWPDEPVPCSDGNHLVFICTDCGAEKNASEPVYLLYNIGIAEVRLRAIEATPCGDFYINGTKMASDKSISISDPSVTIEYRPHINSNINYTPYCYVSTQYGQTVINGTKNEDGSYIATFSVTSTRPHTVVLQNRTEGGNLSFVCYLNLK